MNDSPSAPADSVLPPATTKDVAAGAAGDAERGPSARSHVKLGLGMMLFAGVLWAPLPVLPFLPLSVGVKAAVGTILFIAVQIAWWGGTVLAGPATVRKVYALVRRLQWWKKPQVVDASEFPPTA